MRNLALLLALTLTLSLGAKEKIVDKSGKKPKWVNTLATGYIITMAGDADLESAKQKALVRVKEQIVSSIADNVRTTSNLSSEEQSKNKQVEFFIENYSSATTTESGKTDFVKGISISKVEDFYWEKVYDTDKKSNRYDYHIKYPFSQAELDELITDYKRKDAELTYELDKIVNAIPELDKVEDIQSSIAQLSTLKNSFVDLRQDRAIAAISELRSMIKNMQVVAVSHKLGMLEFELQYDGRSFTYGKNPKVTSACADILNTQSSDGRVLVKYNADYCIEDDPENGIDVLYRIGSDRVTRRFRFDVTSEKVELTGKDQVVFEPAGSGYKVSLTLVEKYGNTFRIEKIDLTVPGEPSITLLPGTDPYSGKGVHLITCEYKGDIPQKKNGTLRGTVYYTAEKSGQSGRAWLRNLPYEVR
ncbi:hypothetical protein KFE98_03945 [bacterium SCSIO 12741]|nr:hypothetical protein KFE98_03945 [bacterium SCSIO 12741]